MAKKISVKLVLELLGKGMSGREIARTGHIAPQSVKKVRDAAEEKGVCWAGIEHMGEREVYDLLFPEQAEAEAACLQVDLEYVHKELMRDGVTLQLLFEEHCDRAVAAVLGTEPRALLTTMLSPVTRQLAVPNRFTAEGAAE